MCSPRWVCFIPTYIDYHQMCVGVFFPVRLRVALSLYMIAQTRAAAPHPKRRLTVRHSIQSMRTHERFAVVGLGPLIAPCVLQWFHPAINFGSAYEVVSWRWKYLLIPSGEPSYTMTGKGLMCQSPLPWVTCGQTSLTPSHTSWSLALTQ